MAKVDDKAYGPQYPGIPVALVTGDSTVMVIRQFVDTPIRGRKTRLLEFRNAPGHYLYLTQEEIQILCKNVADDDDLWIGAEVALVKQTVPSKRAGTNVQVWKIAGASKDGKGPIQWNEWAEVMDAYTKAKTPQRAERAGRR